MMVSILEQSLLFFPLTLGIYISYIVLRIPDLTTDGSFVLGAALFAVSTYAGLSPPFAMVIAMGGGIFSGIAVSLLQTRFHLNPLIAGILLVFILTTLTLKLMGRPNLSLFDRPSIFSLASQMTVLISCSFFFMIAIAGVLASRLGLMLYAFGNNPTLLNLYAKNANTYRMLGLGISNGLVGFTGALTAQANGYADVGMGTGIILIALGNVVVGQQIYRSFFRRIRRNVFLKLLGCLFSTIIYFSIVNILIFLGCDPVYLRLMTGLCLIVFLVMTHEKNGIKEVLA